MDSDNSDGKGLVEIDINAVTKNIMSQHLDDCFEYVSYEHYKYCNCAKEYYEKYAEECLKEYKEKRLKEDREEFKSFHKGEPYSEKAFLASRSEEMLQIEEKNYYEKAIKNIAQSAVKTGIRCNVEKKAVFNLVKLFVTKYSNSVDDPIFIEVIKSVINHSLTVFRLKKISADLGVTQKWIDRQGNNRISTSPLLEAQREFDKIKVDSLMLLDKKLNGEKRLNINLDVSMTNVIEEVFNARFIEN